MNFINRLKDQMGDIHTKVEEANHTTGAILLDVRTVEEYQRGHIPNSVSLPLDRIGEIDKIASDEKTPLYVYCLSGGRSAQACNILKSAGYENVQNIGGISSWKGTIE